MIWIAFFILISNTLIHYMINKTFANIGSIISSWWALIILINAISPFDWYDLSSKAEMILLIGSIAICIGLFLGYAFTIKIVGKRYARYDVKLSNIEEISHSFYTIQIILAVLMIPIIIKSFKLLLKYDFSLYYVRYFYAMGGQEDSLMSTFERLLYIHYGVVPAAEAFIMIDAMLFVRNNCKKPLIYMIVLAMEMIVMNGGRTILFNAGIVLVLSFLLFNRINNNDIQLRQSSKSIRKFIIITFAVAVIITSMRDFSTDSALGVFFDTIISYFGGGIRVFNQTLIKPSLYGLTERTFGKSVFSGLLGAINILSYYTLGRFGINFITDITDVSMIQNALATNIQFGEHSSMNAFPTMFYYFYRDAGIFGIVFFSLVLMILISNRFNIFMSNQTVRNGFKLFLSLNVIIMGVCWWAPNETSFWMKLFWGLLICDCFIYPSKNIAKEELYENITN